MSITSDFYVGWGRYFEQYHPETTTVSSDHPNDTVTVEFGRRDIDGDFETGIVVNGDVAIDNPSLTLETEVEAGGSVTSVSQVGCSSGVGSTCIDDGDVLSGVTSLDGVVGAGTVPPPDTFLQVTVHEVCVGDGDSDGDCADGDDDTTSSPTATFAHSPSGPHPGETVDFDATGASDPGRCVDHEPRVGLRRRDHSPSRTSASTSRFSERLVGVLGPRW